MRRVNVFLASLITTITALITLTIIGFNVSSPTQTAQPDSGWMGQMSGMMGQTETTLATGNSTWYWPLFAVTVALVIVSVVGLIYYMAYPQIKIGIANPPSKLASNKSTINTTASANSVTPYESIEKTLTTEERSVINVLTLHQGKYLQKYITKETGLSKLKTHRIVARLAERGIVKLEKTGNTNQVTLADWLVKKE
ncbi:MAG: hypothetical protein WC325_13070 [Candidatus Bathyarchaeia archaeon]|jgi:uncharacterized membrane protein